MKRLVAKLNVLSDSEIDIIHKSSLEILEDTGIRVPNKECLEICKKFGGFVDFDFNILKIPKKTMNEVLDKIKESTRQTCKQEKKLSGKISTQLSIVDYNPKTRRYGPRRYGRLDDIIKGIVVVEKLSNIPVYNAITVPHDVSSNIRDVKSYQVIYTYSSKPGGTYILSPESGEYIIEMANVMDRKLSYMLETISPLGFRAESLKMALLFAKKGHSLCIAPMPIAGATAPATLAGAITMANVEILASLFIIYALNSQFNNTQSNIEYTNSAHTMDLRTTMCSFGSPNQALLGIAAAQMGKFYGLESSSNSGLSDAIMPDFQCGFEKTISTVLSWLAGSKAIGCQGIVGADQGISLEQLVIDNEWIDAYNYILKGIEVTKETVAKDLIKEVGIGGNFIDKMHTVKHMRENYWESSLFIRDFWDNWVKKGRTNILDRAHEFVKAILEEKYPPEPVIDDKTLNNINYIAELAEKELTKGYG